MCRINEEMCNEARNEGRAEGRIEGKIENSIEVAEQLISMGVCTVEDIAKATKLSIEKVRSLAESLNSE